MYAIHSKYQMPLRNSNLFVKLIMRDFSDICWIYAHFEFPIILEIFASFMFQHPLRPMVRASDTSHYIKIFA